MARFYGWTDSEIGCLAEQKVQAYLLAVAPLKAEEQLDMMRACSYHTLKKDKAKKMWDRLVRTINTCLKKPRTQRSTEDIAASFARGLTLG